MKASGLGQVYGKRFAVPSAACTIASDIGAQFADKFAREAVQANRLGEALRQVSTQASAIAAVNLGLRSKVGGLAKILNHPVFANYEQAQRRAGRRYGPTIAALEIPGEVGIVDLTAAFTALAAGNQAQLAQLRRHLRAQARRGDTQAAALENYLQLLLELLHDEELQRLLLAVRAQVRVLELAILADLRTSARASARRCRPRCEQDPVRTRRCSRAPSATSSLAYYPEVAV
jgi:hypothetical protein